MFPSLLSRLFGIHLSDSTRRIIALYNRRLVSRSRSRTLTRTRTRRGRRMPRTRITSNLDRTRRTGGGGGESPPPPRGPANPPESPLGRPRYSRLVAHACFSFLLQKLRISCLGREFENSFFFFFQNLFCFLYIYTISAEGRGGESGGGNEALVSAHPRRRPPHGLQVRAPICTCK